MSLKHLSAGRFVCCVLGLIMLFSFSCHRDYLQETREQFDQRMEWWRDAGFGMFIHWGIYAVPAGEYGGQTKYGEWIQESADIPVAEYEKYASRFNPVQFNAGEWVRLAKETGMKYIVITSKHHDGFCLWDSKVSEYDIMDRSPFKRDVLKELSAACRKEGIKLCFYHSIMDWHHPDAQGSNYPDYNYGKGPNPNFSRYVEYYLKPQLKELVKGYGPLGVLWFDGEWINEWTEEQGKDLYNYVRSLQPDIIINNRVSKGRDGMQGMNKYQEAVGDFGTPEQEILHGTSDLDWESCMTMNDNWGYNKTDKNFKSAEILIYNLIDIAAKGGNYLLNVGPTAEGLFPEESVIRLKEIGQWMSVNSEVIHNSRRIRHFQETPSLFYTRTKDGKYIHAIVLGWPGSELQIKYIDPEEGSEIQLLGYSKSLRWQKNAEGGTTIYIPEELQLEENRPCKYAYVFRIEGQANEVAEMPAISTVSELVTGRALFTDSITVQLMTETDGAEIHYSIHDQPPTVTSPEYNDPLTFYQTTHLQAMAIKQGMVASKISRAAFLQTTSVKSVRFGKPYQSKYSGLGDITLFDGEQGSIDYNDGKWLGFEQDDLEVWIDLGESRSVHIVNLDFLQNIGAWIFLPVTIAIESSVDGSAFKTITASITDVDERKSGSFKHDFTLTFTPVSSRYIKVIARNRVTCPSWHEGAGGKAWLFCDEIVIE